jgi:hypothetical protein
MNHDGRQILYRVSIRCAVEWGAALARLEQSAHPGFSSEPFEATAWHNALHIVDSLYHGWPIAGNFRNEE